MKKIEAIIRPSALQRLLEAIKIVGYSGITVMEVQGHGKQRGITESYRGQKIESLLSKILIYVVVRDKDVSKIIKAICQAIRTGEIGDGKIFVSPVVTAVRVRTGEKGEKALL
jgi:nitrogen regulatory protein P-II 1